MSQESQQKADTEKARDAHLEVTPGTKNRWADDDVSCLTG